MVSFRWFGQACFEISDSVTIVTDPHDGDSVGLGAPDTEGDIVTISHEHFDHASGEDLAAKPDSESVRGTGSRTVKGIEIQGTDSYHDKVEGSARGENTVFSFTVDGLRICHLGDLGHLLSEKKAKEIRPVDVLLIPVGGRFTIDGGEAAKVVEQLGPRVVVPMHYKVEGLEVPISGPDDFLDSLSGYELEEKEELKLNSSPETKKAIKLECLA